MQIKIQSVSIKFLINLGRNKHLSIVFAIYGVYSSRWQKNILKAEVLLHSEKEHEKYTTTEMHESFSTSGSRPSDHCGSSLLD
jgi:hypothetical protein